MSDEYTFLHMLKDVLFNGNKVSGGKYDHEEEQDISGDRYSGDFSSSRTSRDFNPSDSAGEAFRSVFGDGNYDFIFNYYFTNGRITTKYWSAPFLCTSCYESISQSFSLS